MLSKNPNILVELRNVEYNSQKLHRLLKDSYSFSCSASYINSYKDRGVFLLLHTIAPVLSSEMLLSLLGFPDGDYHELAGVIRYLDSKDGYLSTCTLDHTFSKTNRVTCLTSKGYNFATAISNANYSLANRTERREYEPPFKATRGKANSSKSGNIIHELCLGYTMLAFIFSPLTPFYVVGREYRILPDDKRLQRRNSLRVDAVLKVGISKNGNWKNTIFVEQDQSTETVNKLIDKLDRYYINSSKLGSLVDNFILFSFCQNDLSIRLNGQGPVFSGATVKRFIEVLEHLMKELAVDFSTALSSLESYGGTLEYGDPPDRCQFVEDSLLRYLDNGNLEHDTLVENARRYGLSAYLLIKEFSSLSSNFGCTALSSIDELKDYYNKLRNYCLPEYYRSLETVNSEHATKRAQALIEAYLALVRAHVAGKTDYTSERSVLLFMKGFRVMMTATLLTGNILHFLFPREALYDKYLNCLSCEDYYPGIVPYEEDVFDIDEAYINVSNRLGGLTLRCPFYDEDTDSTVCFEDLSNDLSAWVRAYKFIHGVKKDIPCKLVLVVRDEEAAVNAARMLDMERNRLPLFRPGKYDVVFVTYADLAEDKPDALFYVNSRDEAVYVM